MAQIISFVKRKQVSDNAERLRALVEGRIRHFTCDDCGADIEVIDKNFPKKCPGCGLEIIGWKSEEKKW